MDYASFLKKKTEIDYDCGFDVPLSEIHARLSLGQWGYQASIVKWAVRKGRAALFEDCGLGKTIQQVEWLNIICRHERIKGIIVCPLSVAEQTINEAKLIDVEIVYAACLTECINPTGIYITNYERLDHFDGHDFGAVVLDESSILKGQNGKTKARIFKMFKETPFRLSCTATPSPNDIAEMSNQVEYLGIMSSAEMLSKFFVNDSANGSGWRLKGHAKSDFYRWMATWCVFIRRPSDIGFSDEGFELPPLNIQAVFTDSVYIPDGELFPADKVKGLTGRIDERKKSIQNKVDTLVSLIKTNIDKQCEYGINLQHEQTRESGIQSEVLSGKCGCRQEAEERMVSEKQGIIRQGEKKQLSKGISQGTSGKIYQDKRAERSTEYSTKQEIQRRFVIKRKGTGKSIGMAENESGEKKGSTSIEIQNNTARLQFTLTETRVQMCYMRNDRRIESKDFPFCRPLPRVWESSRSSLHQLQSCAREVQGQYRTTEKCHTILRDQWIVWCGLNDEQKEVKKALDKMSISNVSVSGDTPIEKKLEYFREWKSNESDILISKVKVAGFGLNLQNAHNMAFIGMGDSFEMYYQAIRREYRFGQKKPVNVYLVLTNAEQSILANVMRKERDNAEMIDAVVREMADFTKDEIQTGTVKYSDTMELQTVKGDKFTALLGDSCETIKTLKDESVDLSIFSPPFFSLYTYSPSMRDMGNSLNDDEFWTHFKFLIPELFRVIKTGRICAVHCMQVPALLGKDGYIGIKDFRGDIIENFSACGFVYHGEFVLPKNPQAQSIRTHAKGLTFTQFEKDCSWSRPALLDYMLIFRKPGEPETIIKNGDFEGSEVTRNEWKDIASGILRSVRETYTLNTIKHDGDERHVCPLQLDAIDIITRLYSNKGETVYSPFGGVGSEGYQAILNDRYAILGELKPEYFSQLVDNLKRAEHELSLKNNELF